MRDYSTTFVTIDHFYIRQLEQHKNTLSYCEFICLYAAETFFNIKKTLSCEILQFIRIMSENICMLLYCFGNLNSYRKK